MAKVIVKRALSVQTLALPPVVTIWGEGLDQIDPTVSLTHAVKAAFAARAPRVHMKGPEYHGAFVLEDDWVEVANVGQRLVAEHFCVYKFQGWEANV